MQLLCRYIMGNTQGNRETRLRQEWNTPEDFMEALTQGLSLTTKRFASPLTFSPYLTSCYSFYQEDQLFGANHNAYSTNWTGASQATPETGSAAADKAVRWAIASAQQSQEPGLTALTLPLQGPTGTAYAKRLAHPWCMRSKASRRYILCCTTLCKRQSPIQSKPKLNGMSSL